MDVKYCKAAMVCDSLCGDTYDEIARNHGCKSKNIIARARKKSGLSFKDNRVKVAGNEDEIVSLRESGLSTYEIARVLGLSRECIASLLRKRGLGVGKGGGSVERINAARHEHAMRTIPGSVEQRFAEYGFDVVRRIDKLHYEIRCKTCGEHIERYYSRKDGYRCPTCEKARRESEWWSAPKKQMQIVFTRGINTLDRSIVKECPVCHMPYTEYDWDEHREPGKRRGRSHTTCSPECARKHERNGRRGIYTIPWEKVARHYSTMDCALCGEPVDVTDYTINEDGYFIAGALYPSTDHIVPLSLGGSGAIENCQLVHCLCNSLKGNRMEVTA